MDEYEFARQNKERDSTALKQCGTCSLASVYEKQNLKLHFILGVCVQSLSHVFSLRPHGLQHAGILCLPLSPGVCSNRAFLVVQTVNNLPAVQDTWV